MPEFKPFSLAESMNTAQTAAMGNFRLNEAARGVQARNALSQAVTSGTPEAMQQFRGQYPVEAREWDTHEIDYGIKKMQSNMAEIDVGLKLSQGAKNPSSYQNFLQRYKDVTGNSFKDAPPTWEQGGADFVSHLQQTGLTLKDRLELGIKRAEADRQSRETDVSERRANAAETTAAAAMRRADAAEAAAGKPKLKPGEKYNPEKDRVDAIPGSDVYIKQSNVHAKDYNALITMDQRTKNATAKIDEILSPEKEAAFNSNFGGYNAYLTQLKPGETQDVKAKIESLKSDLKTAGFEIIRSGGSIGQMTEREWPIVQDMIAKLDPKMGEAAARETFQTIRAYLQRINDNAKDTYNTEWSETQFFKPRALKGYQPTQKQEVQLSPKSLAPKNDKGWTLHQDAQGNKAYVGPNGEVEEVQ